MLGNVFLEQRNTLLIAYLLIHCRFEELLRDERVILQELAASEKKFESWSRLPAAAVESTKAMKKAAKQSSSLPPAIAAFEVRLCFT